MKTKLNIKKYVDDAALTWEERYKRLEAHHIKETETLIKIIEKLEKVEDDSWKDTLPDEFFGESW